MATSSARCPSAFVVLVARASFVRACVVLTLCSVPLGGCAPISASGAARLTPGALRSIDLRTLDGQSFHLAAAIRRQRATALVFWATRCPCVRRYRQRIDALQQRFGGQGARFLAIASNADDTPSELREQAKLRRLRLPLLRDAGGRLAVLLGARSTPTVVVLDQRGAVVFRGWIDNERQVGERGRVAYVALALAATLAGRRPAQTSSPVYGCLITRRRGELSHCQSPPPVAPRRPAASR